MSIPNQTPYIIYNANGMTTVFPFEFYIIAASDIQVSINGTVATSGYSVSGSGNVSGGDVVFLTPPDNGSMVMLERVVGTYRLTDYQDNGDLLADTVNKDFDRLWMAIQSSFIYLGLALRRPLFGGPFNAEGYRISHGADPVDAQDFATKNYIDSVSMARVLRVPENLVSPLPPTSARANHLLAFNNDGNPVAVLPESGSAADVLLELASSEPGKGVSLVYNGAKQTDVDYLYGIQGDNDRTAAQIAKRMTDGVYPIISCYGDSTMWGATVGDLGNQSASNPPKMLSEALNLLYGVAITVNNRAISGTTLRQMMTGTDGSGTPFSQKIGLGGVDQDTAVIYCNHGINDSQLNGDILQYRKDLVEFVRICRIAEKVPVLVTPNPNPALLIIDELKSKRLYNYVKTMRDVAEKMGVDIVDQFYFFEASTNLFRIEEIVPDGAHLSPDAYRQAGYNLAIPLISCRSISIPGEQAGLENTTYFDNLTVNRQLQYKGSRTGAILTGDNSSALSGVNYPVVFNKGQSGISYLGLQWATAARCVATVNTGILGEHDNFKYYGDQNSLDWDAEHRFWGRMFAGLKIFGMQFNQGNLGSGNGLTFAGVSIPHSQQRLITKATDGDGSLGVIDPSLESASFVGDFSAGKRVIFSDKFKSPVISLEINSGALICKLYQNGVVKAVSNAGSAISYGCYPVSMTFRSEGFYVNVGEAGISVITERRLPNLRIYTANTSCDVLSGFVPTV